MAVDRSDTSQTVALPESTSETYTVANTLILTGIGTARLARYEHAHIVTPNRVGRHCHFQASDLKRIRKAYRMEHDLGINLPGVEVILRLTDQIEEMQRRLAAYEA